MKGRDLPLEVVGLGWVTIVGGISQNFARRDPKKVSTIARWRLLQLAQSHTAGCLGMGDTLNKGAGKDKKVLSTHYSFVRVMEVTV
jgi:hypothetical protein